MVWFAFVFKDSVNRCFLSDKIQCLREIPVEFYLERVPFLSLTEMDGNEREGEVKED